MNEYLFYIIFSLFLLGGMGMYLSGKRLNANERNRNRLKYFTYLLIFIFLFAFGGDLSASWRKRQYGVKDFSSVLPGHGGFLDRFDSFIVSGVFVYLFNLLFQVS